MAVWKLPELPSGRERNNPWRAKVRGKIHDSPSRKDAEHWERTQLHNYATAGLPLTIDALRKVIHARKDLAATDIRRAATDKMNRTEELIIV